MNKKSLYPLVATVVTAAGIASGGTPALAVEPPRGMNILPYAANCRIGTFPQVSKAGQYNVLCEVMQDSEKCLAYIKGHFRTVGTEVTVEKAEDNAKMQYCLQTLQHDLGIGAEE